MHDHPQVTTDMLEKLNKVALDLTKLTGGANDETGKVLITFHKNHQQFGLTYFLSEALKKVKRSADGKFFLDISDDPAKLLTKKTFHRMLNWINVRNKN